MRGWWIAEMLWLLLSTHPSVSASEIFYARSDGDLQAKTHPGRYSALNILDGDRTTVWCSKETGKDSEIEILFSERTSIERMDIAIGNQSGSERFQDFGRVHEMTISEGNMLHSLSFEDKPGVQTLRFDPTLFTDRLLLKMKSGFEGNEEQHVCISDILFYKANKPIPGSLQAQQMQERIAALPLLDTWVSGPEGTRDRELSFGLSGQYRFVFIPALLDERPVKKAGVWRFAGKNAEMEVDGEWINVIIQRDESGRVEQLLLDKNKLEGTYVRHRRRLREW
jgi:hypothetical protein